MGNPTFRFFFRVVWVRKKWDFPLLGFAGAPIEGPTHFSQFVPLLHEVFGDDWFVRGCISAHYQNMVVEGEEVRAMVEKSLKDGVVRIAAEKRDGTPVLMGTASVGPDYGTTELEQRMERLQLSVGGLGAAREDVRRRRRCGRARTRRGGGGPWSSARARRP